MLGELRITCELSNNDEYDTVFLEKLILKGKRNIMEKRIESEDEDRVREGENARACVRKCVTS